MLTQVIKKPTRVSTTRASIIDHIYINSVYRVNHSGVITYGLSDHDIVYISLKHNLPKKDKISFTCRSLKNYTSWKCYVRYWLDLFLTWVRWNVRCKMIITAVSAVIYFLSFANIYMVLWVLEISLFRCGIKLSLSCRVMPR